MMALPPKEQSVQEGDATEADAYSIARTIMAHRGTEAQLEWLHAKTPQ